MTSLEELKKGIQQNFITPLSNLPKYQIRLLDTTHDQSVKDFQGAIGRLFLPPNPFEGSASNALSQLASNFYQSEQNISDYSTNGISSRMSKLINLCETALSDIHPLMAALHSDASWAAGATFMAQGEQQTNEAMPPGPEDPGWDIAQLVLITVAAGIMVWASADQEMKLFDLWHQIEQWKQSMNGIASEIEPYLPHDPSEMTKNIKRDLPSITFTLNNQATTIGEGELVEQLYQEFGGAISHEDILDILRSNPGLSPDQYRLLVEYFRRNGKMPHSILGIVGVGTNKKGNANKIYYLTAGDLDHIREGHEEFESLSDNELIKLIEQLLQEEPDWADKNASSVTYWYSDVELDGKYYTIGVVVSTDPKNPGRIVTTYRKYTQ